MQAKLAKAPNGRKIVTPETTILYATKKIRNDEGIGSVPWGARKSPQPKAAPVNIAPDEAKKRSPRRSDGSYEYLKAIAGPDEKMKLQQRQHLAQATHSQVERLAKGIPSDLQKFVAEEMKKKQKANGKTTPADYIDAIEKALTRVDTEQVRKQDEKEVLVRADELRERVEKVQRERSNRGEKTTREQYLSDIQKADREARRKRNSE